MVSTLVLCYILLLANVPGVWLLFNVSDVCPYNTFCTSGPVKNMKTDAKYKSCCENCLCSEDCSLFGKCCYDYGRGIDDSAQKQIHFCHSQNELYNFPRNVTAQTREEGFVFITNCSDDYIGNISCMDMTDLNDYIPVSWKVDGRIFVNRKCALCNGVQDVVDWQLNVMMCDILLGTTISSIQEMRKTVLESCIVNSTPPLVLYEDVIKYECTGSKLISSNCMNWKKPNVSNNQELCTNYSKFPHANAHDIIYKTPHCLSCFGNNTDGAAAATAAAADDDHDNDGICLEYSNILKSDPAGLVFLLSMIVEDQGLRPCGVGEIYDTSQDVCTQLHCPTFYVPAFGVCEDFARRVSHYAIEIELKVVTTGIISDPNTFGTRMVRFLKRHFKFYTKDVDADHPCPFVSLFIDRPDENSASVALVIFTSQMCTVYDILANTNTFVNNFKSKTISMGKEVNVSNISLVNRRQVYTEIIYAFNTKIGRLRSFHVNESHLSECPYVKIGIAGHPLEDRILEYARHRPTILTNETLQICVEDYFQLISKSCCLAVMNTLVFWCSVYVSLMQHFYLS